MVANRCVAKQASGLNGSLSRFTPNQNRRELCDQKTLFPQRGAYVI